MQLYFFKQQFETVETATLKGNDITTNVGEVEGSVFDEAVALLRRLEKKLINEISDSVSLDVKAKSRPYRTDKYGCSILNLFIYYYVCKNSSLIFTYEVKKCSL